MAKYSWGAEEGYTEPPFFPAVVIDANGKRIDEVIRCDTATGWCEFSTVDGAGQLVIASGEVQRHWEQHPAPLRLERAAEIIRVPG